MKQWQLAGCERLDVRTTPTSGWSLYSDGWVDRVAKSREPVQCDSASIAMAISAAVSTGSPTAQTGLVVAKSLECRSEPTGSSVVSDSISAGDTTGVPVHDANNASVAGAAAFTIEKYTGPGFVMQMMPDGTIRCGYVG